MGFKPQGMPSAFSRATTGGAQQRRRVIDMLVTINSYDFGQRQINCTAEDGTKMMVQIRPETVARNVNRAKETAGTRPQAPKWEGYMIDQRMADSLPAGQKIVIEKAEKIKTLQVNGATAAVVMSDRVLNIADPNPKKTFEGLFSISTYQNHVFHVQHWLDEIGYLCTDDAAMERIRQSLDEGSTAFLNKELRPHWGVQFRVTQVIAGPDDYPVLDTSPPFEWIPRQFDANNQEIAPGHPLDGAKFNELLFDPQNGYIAYAKSKFPEDQYPGCVIEVVPYVNYRAGPRSRYMAIPEKQFDPLYKLANTQTKLAIDDDTFAQGKNVAVKGVLQLSADQADLATHTFKTRNIAVRLHANGPMGHVHAWVRAFDGHKTRPHEALRQVQVQKATPGEKAPGAMGYGQEQSGYNAPPAYSPPPAYTPPAYTPPPAQQHSGMDARSVFEEEDWSSMDDEDPFGAPSSSGPDTDALRRSLDDARRNMQGE